MKPIIFLAASLLPLTLAMRTVLHQRSLKVLPDSFTELNIFSQDLTSEIKEDSTDINIYLDIRYPWV
jgi:hypothetical protein